MFQLTLSFKQLVQTLIRRRVLRRLIWACTICQYHCPGFTDNLLYKAFLHHNDKNGATINNRYLDFVQTRGLISLVNDYHVDKDLKEILVHVYFGSIVNNRLKREETGSLLYRWHNRNANTLGGAKVLCILHHWGVQLILAYSWARPAILVVGKGRGGMFLFLLFLHFHSCSSFFPVPLFHLLYSLFYLFSPFLWETTQNDPQGLTCR